MLGAVDEMPMRCDAELEKISIVQGKRIAQKQKQKKENTQNEICLCF